MTDVVIIGGMLAVGYAAYFFIKWLDSAEEKEMRRIYEQRVKDQDACRSEYGRPTQD